jgi:hypothetical protein
VAALRVSVYGNHFRVDPIAVASWAVSAGPFPKLLSDGWTVRFLPGAKEILPEIWWDYFKM